MNNTITATIFIALMLTMGIATAYVFTPSPAVLYKTTEGVTENGDIFYDAGGRKGR